MKCRFLIILPFYIISLHSQNFDKAAHIGYKSIEASDLETHIGVLASDSLEGRETAYAGQKKAAHYISDYFKKLKLDPIGDRETYFQHFDVEVMQVSPETKILTNVRGMQKEFALGTNFIVEYIKDTIVTGPVAFVGFTDTELESVDLEKLAGRIVIAFIGKKKLANDTTRATIFRRLFAIRRDAGAAATLVVPDLEGPAGFENARRMLISIGRDKGSMKMKDSAEPERSRFIQFLISTEIAMEMLKPSGKSLQQIRNLVLQDEPFAPIFLDDAIVTIKSRIIHETRQTENVVGLLRGTDPILKTQIVAFTAHYDHLGKSSDGNIFYGADDNASGTAALLELAEAFIKNPAKPKRSFLFAAMVGEEKGLFGSKYYVNNPIIPLNQTIAGLNIDMIGRLDTLHEASKDTNYIYIIGSDMISFELDSLLQISNKETENLFLDYKYNDEYEPERFYRRGDHYNFARNDIPIVFFFNGIHNDYHKPTDTADKILLKRMVKVGHVIYNLGWRLANIDHSLRKKPAQ